MGIKTIKALGFNFDEKEKGPSAIWELDIFGNLLRLERYGGLCRWDRIEIKKGNKRVYAITLDGESRTEFFFDKPTRKYSGNQFSFVEYVSVIAELERISDAQDYIKAGLDPGVEKQYRGLFQKIIELKS